MCEICFTHHNYRVVPRGMSETAIQKGVSETVSTSVYGSEDPLLNTGRSPPRPPVVSDTS